MIPRGDAAIRGGGRCPRPLRRRRFPPKFEKNPQVPSALSLVVAAAVDRMTRGLVDDGFTVAIRAARARRTLGPSAALVSSARGGPRERSRERRRSPPPGSSEQTCTERVVANPESGRRGKLPKVRLHLVERTCSVAAETRPSQPVLHVYGIATRTAHHLRCGPRHR